MLFLLLATVVLAESTSWYVSRAFLEQESHWIKEKECFRGTYGPYDFSLLTCEVEGASFINELPSSTPLCVVELASEMDMQAAIGMATESGNAFVFHKVRNSFVLAPRNPTSIDYPSTCEVTLYRGLALNVIFVPLAPILPIIRPAPISRVAIPNPRIQAVLNSITTDKLYNLAVNITSYLTRLSTSQDAVTAVNDWTRRQETVTQGTGWTVTQYAYRAGFCNNVIAEKKGSLFPDRYVVLGAHFDSRSTQITNASQRAPGADDNGSGSVSLSALVEGLVAYPYQTAYTLRVIWFCGEEQGLVGSNAIASNRTYFPQGSIVVMVNLDMLGKNINSTMGWMNRSVDLVASRECLEIAGEYYPSLKYDITTGCCSDQQSFFNAGFPAVGYFETATPNVMYTAYHQSNDTVDNGEIDWNQVRDWSRFGFACALAKAGHVE